MALMVTTKKNVLKHHINGKHLGLGYLNVVPSLSIQIHLFKLHEGSHGNITHNISTNVWWSTLWVQKPQWRSCAETHNNPSLLKIDLFRFPHMKKIDALKRCLASHRGYVNKQMTRQSHWCLFNLPGHTLANLKITTLKQVRKNGY